MELCKNGKSVRLDFVIKRKNGEPITRNPDAYEVVIYPAIPIKDLRDPNRRARLAILAFLHVRHMPTHDKEMGKYVASPRDDSDTIRDFLAKALAERKAEEEAAKAERQAAKAAAKASQPKAAPVRPIVRPPVQLLLL